MNNRLLLLFFWYVSIPCFAQNLEEGERIAPDRPGFGDAVSIASTGAMHIETGTWLEQDRNDSLTSLGLGISSTLFRYGLFKRVELRLDYNFWNQVTPAIKESELGLYPIRAGMKLHLLTNKGVLPSITFIGMQELPFTATKNFKPKNLSTDLQLSFANKVSDKFALCYNLGAVLNESTSYYYALSAEFSLTEKTGYYLQTHSNFQKEKGFNGNYTTHYIHYLETGLMFYPNHNAQIDVSGGLKAIEDFEKSRISSEQHSCFFISVGFSWRFDLRAKK